MLSAITPVSFKNAKFEAATKFIGNEGKQLDLFIKAHSNAPKSYVMDVFVQDGKIIKGYYSSGVANNNVPGFEYFDNAGQDIMKLAKLFDSYEINDKGKIMGGLMDFFAKAAQ